MEETTGMKLDKEGCMLSFKCLNYHAMHLDGDGLSFLVHYWGGQPDHFNNLVHQHSIYEACYVVAGEGVYMEKNKEYRLTAGTVFCSPPGIDHQIRSDAGMHLLFVGFEVLAPQHESGKTGSDRAEPGYAAEYKRALQPDDNVLIRNNAKDSPSATLWRALWTQAAIGHADTSRIVRPLARALLESFPQTFAPFHRTTDRAVRTKEYAIELKIGRARLFISDNLDKPLTVIEVATYLGMSPRHLSRLMKRYTGHSFTDYVLRERLVRAKGLLLNTQLSIEHIASLVGFSSIHYFSKMFKWKNGISPSRFRTIPSDSELHYRFMN